MLELPRSIPACSSSLATLLPLASFLLILLAVGGCACLPPLPRRRALGGAVPAARRRQARHAAGLRRLGAIGLAFVCSVDRLRPVLRRRTHDHCTQHEPRARARATLEHDGTSAERRRTRSKLDDDDTAKQRRSTTEPDAQRSSWKGRLAGESSASAGRRTTRPRHASCRSATASTACRRSCSSW